MLNQFLAVEVVFEVGVPEGGGVFEDEGLEFFAVGGAGGAAHGGEGHVVGAGEVEEEGVGLCGVVEGGSAGAGADHAEFVVGAGEVEHGDFDGVEGGVLGSRSLEPEPDMAMPALMRGSARWSFSAT